MSVGRPPKPTRLKVLEGNPGGRPLNKSEPKPSPGIPAAPSWLSKEAAAEWRRVVPALGRIGMLDKVDRAALAAYAECWAVHKAACQDVAANGIVLEVERPRFSRNGDLLATDILRMRNPAVGVQRDAAAQLRAYCSEFGLSPSARVKLTAPELEDGDLAGLLAPVRSVGRDRR